MKIRVNDEVMVVSGDDRGKRGKVHRSFPREGRVQVEGVNVGKRHMKPRGNIRQAGIIEFEAPLAASKVMLICTKCHEPTRVGYAVLEDKSKVRVCRKCHEVID